MREEDKKFVTSVTTALMQVRDANVRKSSQSLSMGDETTVEASVVLTREVIRQQTGRDKLRDVVVDELATAFAKQYGVEVSRTGNKGLLIKTIPIERQSEFTSFNDLLAGASRAKKYLDDDTGW